MRLGVEIGRDAVFRLVVAEDGTCTVRTSDLREDDVTIEHDRHAAIGRAIRQAVTGDVVLIAGKGHESEQVLAGERRPFSDRAAAAEWLGGAP